MMWNRYLIACLALLAGCSGEDQPGESAADPYKPPLYWDVYEYHIVRQQVSGRGPTDVVPGLLLVENYIPESEFMANIDWVEEDLKPFGYDMVAIDGWGDTERLSEHGYRASHSSTGSMTTLGGPRTCAPAACGWACTRTRCSCMSRPPTRRP
jgi:hypothetical protein